MVIIATVDKVVATAFKKYLIHNGSKNNKELVHP